GYERQTCNESRVAEKLTSFEAAEREDRASRIAPRALERIDVRLRVFEVVDDERDHHQGDREEDHAAVSSVMARSPTSRRYASSIVGSVSRAPSGARPM